MILKENLLEKKSARMVFLKMSLSNQECWGISIGDSLEVGVIGLGKMGLLHASLLRPIVGVHLAVVR